MLSSIAWVGRCLSYIVLKEVKIVGEKINAILINEVDDVATAIADFQKGDVGTFDRNGEIIKVVLIESVPKFHKFAVTDIADHEPVRKYGEVIGVSTQKIRKGSHVHEHNIASPVYDNDVNKG